MKGMFRLAAASSMLLATALSYGLNFVAIQDADAVSGVDAGNGWDDNTLGMSAWISENYSGATDVVAHVQWDLSSLAPGSVASATLELFHEFNGVSGSNFDIVRVLDPWSEATLTYLNRPNLDPTVWATLSVGDNGTQVIRSVDVTALVQGWVNGTFANEGLAFTKSPANTWPYFRSKDHGSGPGPTLVITTVPEPATMAAMGIGLAALLRRRRK